MHDDATSTTLPSPAQQAAAALRATTVEGKAENTSQVAALADAAAEAHIAEHIRGVVAWTVACVPIDASAITREHTEHWQQWALSVADGVERGPSALA